MSTALRTDEMNQRLSPQDEATLSCSVSALIRVSRQILRNYPSVSVDCEDVVQDALLETTQKLQAGFHIENLAAYLRAAVVNRSLNRAKQLNRSKGILFELDNGFEGYMIAATQDEPIDKVLETEGRFTSCRNLLKEREQLVLDMLMEGFSPREIAEILAVEMGHVYVITHRLRRKFNYLLSEKRAAD